MDKKALATMISAQQAVVYALWELLIDKGVVSAEEAHTRLSKVQEEMQKSDLGIAVAETVTPLLEFLETKYGLRRPPAS